MEDFRGKVAVVTGAGSGIGLAVVRALAKSGTDVVIADREEPRLEEVQVEVLSLGRRALAVPCDVSKDGDVEDLAKQAFASFGQVDILMNNAGIWFDISPDKMTMADWDRLLGINLFGILRGVRAFLPHMLERGSGYIVNTSSMVGLFASNSYKSMGDIAYTTSKFAVVGFSESLAIYARPRGVGVSVLCPGLMRTRMYDVVVQAMGSDRPAPVSVTPEEVAALVLEAMRQNRFLITTSPAIQARMLQRAQDIEAYLEDRIKTVGQNQLSNIIE